MRHFFNLWLTINVNRLSLSLISISNLSYPWIVISPIVRAQFQVEMRRNSIPVSLSEIQQKHLCVTKLTLNAVWNVLIKQIIITHTNVQWYCRFVIGMPVCMAWFECHGNVDKSIAISCKHRLYCYSNSCNIAIVLILVGIKLYYIDLIIKRA